MKAVLANLGFILQMTALFFLVPVVVGIISGEESSIVGILLTAVMFFAFGFGLNALCERKELTLQQSNILILLSFLLLGIIGGFPYFYSTFADQPVIDKVTNSIFESVSGFTTTGFSVIENVDVLPKSIIIYRAITQFIGGIGIVLLLLLMFYPEEKLKSLAQSLGVDRNEKIKKTFILIIFIYLIIGLVVGAGAYLQGYHNVTELASYVMSAMSTGGFAPSSDTSALDGSLGSWLIVCMVLGATNFIVLAGFFKLRFRRFWDSEVPLFLLILILGISTFHIVSDLPWRQSFFHAVSASSTAGFTSIDLTTLAVPSILILTLLMFIGGTTLSTAGGIRILRFASILKLMPFVSTEIIKQKSTPFKIFGKEYPQFEIIHMLMTVILMSSIVCIGTVILHLNGFDFIHSLFEVVSAITCSGLSIGIANADLSTGFKWMFTAIMFIGRIEIFTLFVSLTSLHKKL